MNEIQKYLENKGLTVLPDNVQWKNRFEIESASSDRVYIIAQRKSDDTFGCSCPGWRIHRKCKHLASIAGLLSNIPVVKQIA